LEEYWHVPALKWLKDAFGMEGFSGTRPSILWFDLEPLDVYSEWKGQLIVRWRAERSWWRWAARSELPVHVILEDSLLDAAMPGWEEIILSWEELNVLPGKWRSALSQWRGIYYIHDSSDGKGYVGAAYGSDNILGRWLHYGAVGHGGNTQLRKRAPHGLRFSILQRVSPDMEPENVIRLESTWKDRLHTRTPSDLNDN
jgi:hypothetical protein